MKRYSLIILFAFVLLLSGCSSSDNKTQKVQMDPEASMSFTFESEPVQSGKDAVVYVKTNNSPGFLTMALTIGFDSDAMALIKVENGQDFLDYNFIAPKALKNGSRISWFVTDLPNKPADGELVKLYFRVFDTTKEGEYQVSISPVNDGGIVDGNYNLIPIVESHDVIKVNNNRRTM